MDNGRRWIGWRLLVLGPILFLGPSALQAARGESITPIGWGSLISLAGLLTTIVAPFVLVLTRPPTPRRWHAHAIIWTTAIALPLLLVAMSPEWVQTQFGGEALRYFGLFATIALVLSTLMEIRVRGDRSWRSALPVLLLSVVLTNHLAVISESPVPAFDWTCYKTAANELMAGRTPYGSRYLYPPLLAQVYAGMHDIIMRTMQAWGLTSSPRDAWALIFYLHQALQLLLIAATWYLCYALGRRLGLGRLVTAVLVTVLLVANIPFASNMLNNQINLWILDLMLLGVLLAHRSAILAGGLVALASMIKIQPLILLLPWAMRRQWVAVSGLFLGMAVILGIQTGGFQHWELWQQFAEIRAAGFPVGEVYRDSSIRGLLHNGATIVGPKLGLDARAGAAVADVVYLVLTISGLGWLICRAAARRRDGHRGRPSAEAHGARPEAALWGDYADAFAAIVVLSPLVWQYHAVHMIPVVIWALAAFPRNALQIALGALLVFWLPKFDLWPLGHLRLAGALIVLVNASPLRDRPWPHLPGDLARRWQRWLGDALTYDDAPDESEKATRSGGDCDGRRA